MSEIARITVSGDPQGDFVVTEERGADEFVIVREAEPSLMAPRARDGSRGLTDEEWQDFIAEHGPHMLPPDGEG